MKRIATLILGYWLVLLSGCQREPAAPAQQAAVHKHEHKPPHGGTPVVLGNEQFHIELVLDQPAGRLQAYVLDGEMENFVRVQAESFELSAMLKGGEEVLTFRAIANNATGETVGNSSLFEAQAEWLKTNATFDGVLRKLDVRGTTFEKVTFNFPKGNDTD